MNEMDIKIQSYNKQQIIEETPIKTIKIKQ